MTKAQKRLLLEALHQGYIFYSGGWGRSQFHRPARTLVELGLLEYTWVPPDEALQCQGWVLTGEGREAVKKIENPS